MSLAAVIVASLALIVSCLSLGWQIFSFNRSGRRAKVYVSIGWRGNGTQLLLQSIKRRDDPLDVLSRLSGNGPSTPVLGVTVHNVGRSDLYVSAVFIMGKSRASSHLPASGATWPALPHLLKAGDSENWYLDIFEFMSICKTLGDGNIKDVRRLGMRITLKDGQTITVRRLIKLEELQRIWNVSTNTNGVSVD
ncbi:hypothetical protein [Lentzea sp. NPDC003310]|uniref:hypothetical protein n=1 Tax=Lentzea sp. NPDC003310 TaxID=3154447 RepID=UPI0033A5C984